MDAYVEKALFITTDWGRALASRVVENSFNVRVTAVAYDRFASAPDGVLEPGGHVVIAGSLSEIKGVLDICRQRKASVGIIPLPNQKDLIRSYDLPGNSDAAVKLALRRAGTRCAWGETGCLHRRPRTTGKTWISWKAP